MSVFKALYPYCLSILIKYIVELGADVNYRCINNTGTVIRNKNIIGYKYKREYLEYEMLEYVILFSSDSLYGGIDRNYDIVKYLIRKGANINNAIKYIHYHRRSMNVNIYTHMIKYLYNDDIYLHKNDKMIKVIKNIIINACHNGNLELVIFFLENGIYEYINEMLEVSSAKCNINIIKLLIENKNYYKYINLSNNMSLVIASEHGHLDIVKVLINYIDVNNHNGLALIKSCENEYLETVVFLVENRANIFLQNNGAFNVSAKDGYIDIIKYLVEKGSPVKLLKRYRNNTDINNYLVEVNFKADDIFNNNDDDNYIFSNEDNYISEDDYTSENDYYFTSDEDSSDGNYPYEYYS